MKYNEIDLVELQEKLGDCVKVMGIYKKKKLFKTYYLIKIRYNEIYPVTKATTLKFHNLIKKGNNPISSAETLNSLEWVKNNKDIINAYCEKFSHVTKIVEFYTNGQGFLDAGYDEENDFEYKFFPIKFDLRSYGLFFLYFTSGSDFKRVG